MSDVTKIYNYVPINDQIASSGQLSSEQFSAIKKAGYDVVIAQSGSGQFRRCGW